MIGFWDVKLSGAPPLLSLVVRYARGRSHMGIFDGFHGSLNKHMICPHCQNKGAVRTKRVQRKRGISGGKATGALLTGGLSLLATGLSRKQTVTEAWCGTCKSTWEF